MGQATIPPLKEPALVLLSSRRAGHTAGWGCLRKSVQEERGLQRSPAPCLHCRWSPPHPTPPSIPSSSKCSSPGYETCAHPRASSPCSCRTSPALWLLQEVGEQVCRSGVLLGACGGHRGQGCAVWGGPFRCCPPRGSGSHPKPLCGQEAWGREHPLDRRAWRGWAPSERGTLMHTPAAPAPSPKQHSMLD